MIERTTAGRSLRAVSAAIAVVAIVSLFSVGYSAYRDSGTLIALSDGSKSLSEETVMSAAGATVYFNATVPNGGLLPLEVTFACSTSEPGVTCTTGSVTVQPGEQGLLSFSLLISNYTQFRAEQSSLPLDGNFTFALIPFASMQAKVNIGSLTTGGQGG